MFSTSITQTFGLTTPIVNAGMAMIARPALAAAVCEAGGLGTIGSDINPPDVLRHLVRKTKTITKRPFGVDLIGDFVTDPSSLRNRWRSPSSSGRCRRLSMSSG
jgi:NAD(P)H-dependent flavin oxidoreductase YrpB (nitropropane dioxygenase family)